MSARKLGRFAGLLLALAIAFGGLSDVASGPESTQAEVLRTQVWEWA
ncbi:hypothetical protein [Actinoplanes utahensis]|nr:hypothetical protein [Actinoplanes utahensis]